MSALASLPRPEVDYKVQFSADGSTWRDVCSQMVSVVVEEQERAVAVTHTACKGPLVTLGNRGPVTVHFRFLFTELTASVNGAWVVVRTQWLADLPLYYRYQPRVSQSDSLWYIPADADGDSAPAQIARLLYPAAGQGATPFIAGLTCISPRLITATPS